MLNFIESWLLNKTSGHVNKKNLAKLLSGVLLAVLGIVTFIRYELIKNAGAKAELQNALTKDAVADAVTKAKIDVIDVKVEQHMAAAKTAEHSAAVAAKAVTKIADEKKSDTAVINSIDSWADVDSKIK
jgi:hypothetical protein